VWSPVYRGYIDGIERVQRKFLKFLSFKADGVYPEGGIDNPILLERFQMDSLECRRNFSINGS